MEHDNTCFRTWGIGRSEGNVRSQVGKPPPEVCIAQIGFPNLRKPSNFC